MPNETYQRIMDILEDERKQEMLSAMKCNVMMSKTLNPIKRNQLKRSYDMFVTHACGIYWAMSRVRREFEP